MLTIIEATELLSKCFICPDIQNKILILFIGINGTPTSNIIKYQIKFTDTGFNGCMFERIIKENNANTLWRLKFFLNRGKTSNKLYVKNLKVIFELHIAYLTNGSNDLKRMEVIARFLETIKTNSDSELFEMFYNLDKKKYKYLGTLTANIIHNAISSKIIKEFDPIV